MKWPCVLMMDERNFADKIASLCYQKYDELPKQGKPTQQEWTLLAGCIKVEGWKAGESLDSDSLDIVSLGTGSKCIGQGKLSRFGDILNDSHAEVMARRGFLRYLYEEINKHCTSKSDIFEESQNNGNGKCVLKKNVSFHFFTSHTPCGDASIFPVSVSYGEGFGECISNSSLEDHSSETVNNQIENDKLSFTRINYGKRKLKFLDSESKEKVLKLNHIKTQSEDTHTEEESALENGSGNVLSQVDLYRTGAKCLKTEERQDLHLPGPDYHVVGPVRTKPGRGDPTLSVSCSDKLARWNAVGVQGALLSLLLDAPVYFQSITIAGGCPYSEEALYRAVKGRMSRYSDLLASPYSVASPLLIQSTIPFSGARTAENDKNPCPSSVVWSKVRERCLEVAVAGKRQGVTKKAISTPAGRLLICKRELLKKFLGIVKLIQNQNGLYSEISDLTAKDSYKILKQKAHDYQNAWNRIRSAAFSAWSPKPGYLLEFTVEDET